MSVDPALWYIVILSLVSSITDLHLLVVHDWGHWLHARRSLSSSPFLCLCMCTTLYRDRWEFATCLVRVWLASAFIFHRNHLLHNLQTQHFCEGKRVTGNEMNGEWSGPENGMLVDCGKGWPGLGPEWMWGWNAVVMGTVKWRWEARWYNSLIMIFTNTIEWSHSKRKYIIWVRFITVFTSLNPVFAWLSFSH